MGGRHGRVGASDRQGTVSGRSRHPRPRIPSADRPRRRGPDGCRTQRLSVSSGSWRSSSVVEQGTHKPLVGGSNPPSATRPIPSDGPPTRRAVSIPSSSDAPPSARRPASVPMSEGQDLRHGVVIGTRRYTRTHRRRTVVARSTPEAPFEPQVLPQRHRDAGARRRHRCAAVHLAQSRRPTPTPDRLLGVPDRRPATTRSTSVVQQGETLTVKLKRPRRRPTRSPSRAILTQVYDDMQSRRPRPATSTLQPDDLQGASRRPTPRGSGCS